MLRLVIASLVYIILDNEYFRSIVSDKCTNGEVRLASGGVSNGRVEVCYEGVWGSVCGQGFDHTDAYVVCKELGRGVSGNTLDITLQLITFFLF